MDVTVLATRVEAVLDKMDSLEKHLREWIDDRTAQLEVLIRDSQKTMSSLEVRMRETEKEAARVRLALAIIGTIGTSALGVAIKLLLGSFR